MCKFFTLPDDRLLLIIATTAFGMAIDCPGIKTVTHWGLPRNIEAHASLIHACETYTRLEPISVT